MKLKFLPSLLLGASLMASSALSAQWTQVGVNNLDTFTHSANSSDYIHAMTTDASGNLYAAGRFLDQDSYTYVAKWNGTSWVELGTGVNALKGNDYIYSLCTDRAGNVYAAGKFNSGSTLNCYVAKWNGTTWAELGAGQNVGSTFAQSIKSICADTLGNIYAAGELTNASVKYEVYKWDGSNWAALGALDANAAINTIAVDGNKVYAGGEFINGSFKRYMAVYNGTSWSEAAGLDAGSAINAITVDPSHNVYAAGEFTDAANNNYVAKWNGSTWTELGGPAGIGFTQSVGGIYTLAHDPAGNIYAAGGFLDANVKEYVAKWNGSSWSHLGTLNAEDFINVVMVSGTNIYAAGAFRNATSEPYIAKYSLTTGITELDENTYRMYPNPVSSSFHIRFAKPITATVTVTDLAGQEVASYSMAAESEKTFTTSSFSAGIYLVRIATASGDTRTMKLVKE